MAAAPSRRCILPGERQPGSPAAGGVDYASAGAPAPARCTGSQRLRVLGGVALTHRRLARRAAPSSTAWARASLRSVCLPCQAGADVVNVTAAEDTEVLLLHIGQMLEPCAKVYPHTSSQDLLTPPGRIYQLSPVHPHTLAQVHPEAAAVYFSECIKRTGSCQIRHPDRQRLNYLNLWKRSAGQQAVPHAAGRAIGMRKQHKTRKRLWRKGLWHPRRDSNTLHPA